MTSSARQAAENRELHQQKIDAEHRIQRETIDTQHKIQIANTEAELHRQNRETLFSNEKFIIGILQAVNGAIVAGLISQFDNIEKHFGVLTIKVIMTTSVISLILAIIAAYCKHEYKKWDIKIATSKDNGEKEDRLKRTSIYLKLMRCSITFSVLILCVGLIYFLISIWGA